MRTRAPRSTVSTLVRQGTARCPARSLSGAVFCRRESDRQRLIEPGDPSYGVWWRESAQLRRIRAARSAATSTHRSPRCCRATSRAAEVRSHVLRSLRGCEDARSPGKPSRSWHRLRALKDSLPVLLAHKLERHGVQHRLDFVLFACWQLRPGHEATINSSPSTSRKSHGRTYDVRAKPVRVSLTGERSNG